MSVKERFMRIQELIIDIQLNTEYGVFVYFMGHVGSMSVDISVSKDQYSEEAKFLKIDFLKFDEWCGIDPVAKMDKTIEALEGVLDGRIKPIVSGEEVVPVLMKVYEKVVI